MKRSAFIFFLILNVVFSLANSPDYRIKKVVIDAGHGGKDPGCLGASSKEKDICLSIALNLGKFISENLKEVEVIYTRSTDVFPTLHERAKIANDNKADLFICIHANSSKSPHVFGAETYVMGLHVSEANLEVAKRENSTILMEDNYKIHYEGFDPNSAESYIALSLLQNTYLEQSLNLASKIQKQFAELKRADRGVKQAGFLVLYRTAMPSVLIETGFLSNPDEEKFLADSLEQVKVAFAIFEAFKDYKNEIERGFSGKSQEEKPKQKGEVKNEKKDTTPEIGFNLKETKPESNLPPEVKKEDKGNEKKEENREATKNGIVVYKVQLASSSKKLDLKSEKFKGIDRVDEYIDGGVYKYVTGSEKSMERAAALQKNLKANGHPDAFMVAFYNEKRITLAEANKIQAAGKKQHKQD